MVQVRQLKGRTPVTPASRGQSVTVASGQVQEGQAWMMKPSEITHAGGVSMDGCLSSNSKLREHVHPPGRRA